MGGDLRIYIRWFVLLLLQVMVLNNINFGGYINPQITVLFVILYPYYKKNRGLLLFSSFALGLAVDFFMNSGAINAFALTTIAYFRNFIFKVIFGQTEKGKTTLRDYPILKVLNFVIILTFIHHVALFWLENFSVNEFANLFSRITLTTIASSFLSFITISLIANKE